MKKLFLVIVAMMMAMSAFAQHDIKLTVSGQGATKEEATANALRSAIEQSFGAFVSANTQILNDEIVKDEIATIASGNIKEYQELGCIDLPGGDQSVTLAATVSLGNLISYSKSKGSTAEFAGAAFTMNMRMRKLNAENEITALYNMLDLLYELAPSAFDWDLEVGDPASLPEQMYNVKMTAKAKANKNTSAFFSLFLNTLESLSLSASDVDAYRKNEMEVFHVKVNQYSYALRNNPLAYVAYIKYLFNCAGESFDVIGQFEGYKARLDDDVVSEHLAGMRREWNYVNGDYGRTEVTLSLDVNNLNEFLNAKPGTVLFSRKTSVVLDEQDLYKLYAIEIAPGNISRMSFVRNNGEMVIDTMNVYQEVGFFSVDDRWGLDYSILTDVTKYLKKMRVLYVDEECPLTLTDRSFEEWPNLETVYLGCLNGNIDAFLFNSCRNLETVRIGSGVTIVNANAFSYVDNLKHLIIGSTLDCGNGIVLDLLSLNDIDLISCPNIIIGDGVKVVNSLSYSLYLESLVIGRDVEQIVDMYYMRGVKKVVDLRLSSSEHDAYIEGLINLLHR